MVVENGAPLNLYFNRYFEKRQLGKGQLKKKGIVFLGGWGWKETMLLQIEY